jgi:hypothetical protein
LQQETLPEGSASALYEKLVEAREPYLNRARACAKLTIPSLMLEVGATSNTDQYTPYQSIGARGLNNLSSKLLLALFPPNAPFFRYNIDEFTKEEIAKADPKVKAEMEAGLNKMERAIQGYLEDNAIRITAFEAMKHLLGNGNVLLNLPDDGGSRIFSLDQYVVVRDPSGTVLRMIIKEMVSIDILTDAQLALLEIPEEQLQDEANKDKRGSKPKTVAIYTDIRRTKRGSWIVNQEIKGQVVPGSAGTYPKDKCAYIPLRFRKIDGEDYGRSFVEEIIGDLYSVEGLAMSMVEGAAALAKIIFLVDPNGVTSKKTLSEAPNLAVRDGKAENVTVVQANKAFDLKFAYDQLQDLKRDLSLSFLLHSAVQRDAERVTAEEIRYIAQELDSTLSGFYSIMSQDLQISMVLRISHILQRQRKLPRLPEGTVKPQIIAGLDAVGRGNDLNRLDTFINGIKTELGPEAIERYVDIPTYLTKRATAIGLEAKDLIKSAETIAQEAKQVATAEMVNTMGPEVVKQTGAFINNRASEAAVAPPQTRTQ